MDQGESVLQRHALDIGLAYFIPYLPMGRSERNIT